MLQSVLPEQSHLSLVEWVAENVQITDAHNYFQQYIFTCNGGKKHSTVTEVLYFWGTRTFLEYFHLM